MYTYVRMHYMSISTFNKINNSKLIWEYLVGQKGGILSFPSFLNMEQWEI